MTGWRAGAPGARPHDDARSAAIRALRQHDLKLLLAYGTVSQLGFLVVLVRRRHPRATLAGLGCSSPTRCSRRPSSWSSASSTTAPAPATSASCPGLAARLPRPRRHRDAGRRVDGRVSPRCSGSSPRRACSSRSSTSPATVTAPGSVRRAAGCSSSGWSSGRSSPRPTRPASCGEPSATGRWRLRCRSTPPRPPSSRPPSSWRPSRWCSASSVPRSRRSSTPRPTSSRPGPTSPSSRCGTASGCPWCSPSSRSPPAPRCSSRASPSPVCRPRWSTTGASSGPTAAACACSTARRSRSPVSCSAAPRRRTSRSSCSCWCCCRARH